MKKSLFILLILLQSAALVFAQGKFTSSASKTNVGVGEEFEVDFSLNGEGGRYTAPDFHDFQVLSGPQGSNSMQSSSSGGTSFNTTISYILAATKEGTLTIDEAAIVSNGHTLTTSQLKIHVKGQA